MPAVDIFFLAFESNNVTNIWINEILGLYASISYIP